MPNGYVEEAKSYRIQYPLRDYTFPKEAKADKLTFDDSYMHIHLKDGRIVSVPLVWIPTLYHAEPADREKYEIEEDGLAIHWDPDTCAINEDLYVASWLEGGSYDLYEDEA